MDVKETKEVIRFGLSLGNALRKAMEDGNINLLDALKFLPVLRELKPAIEGAKKIPAELKDLDEAEKAELLAYFKKEFELKDDELEAKVEMALEVGLSLSKLALGFLKK